MKRKRSSSPPAAVMPPAASHPPAKMAMTSPPPPFPLTDLEQELFQLLMNVTKEEELQDLTLRVAGGWVRDKILNPTENLGADVDIDIALDKMLGRDFANAINSYLKKHGLGSSSVGIIARNPDQSKHLETATMRVMDIWLDLVNLRTETYSHDSRIPDMSIGTPEEDAKRRDLTINALFYNINTRALEDFTGHGFDDIRARIVRTPLPPLKTLLDDPLRALRAIRFASRLDFRMDEDLFQACSDKGVHYALGAKVSRERISTEVDQMLAAESAVHSMGLLVELGLFDVVFRLPTQAAGEKALPSDFPLHALGSLVNQMRLGGVKGVQDRLLRYAVMLSSVMGCTCFYAQGGKKLKEHPVALYMLQQELRLSQKDATEVITMHEGATKIQSLVHRGADKLERLETGRVIRSAGKTWRGSTRVALLLEMEISKERCSFQEGAGEVGCLSKEMEVLARSYEAFEKKVDELKLEGVWEVKPVVNGNEVVEMCKVKKGPVLGKIMTEQVEWMIEHPGKGKESVVEWLKEKYGTR